MLTATNYAYIPYSGVYPKNIWIFIFTEEFLETDAFLMITIILSAMHALMLAVLFCVQMNQVNISWIRQIFFLLVLYAILFLIV